MTTHPHPRLAAVSASAPVATRWRIRPTTVDAGGARSDRLRARGLLPGAVAQPPQPFGASTT